MENKYTMFYLQQQLENTRNQMQKDMENANKIIQTLQFDQRDNNNNNNRGRYNNNNNYTQNQRDNNNNLISL